MGSSTPFVAIDSRRKHDIKSALQSLKMAADLFEIDVEVTQEERRDIAAKLRQSHALLVKEFEQLLTRDKTHNE